MTPLYAMHTYACLPYYDASSYASLSLFMICITYASLPLCMTCYASSHASLCASSYASCLFYDMHNASLG